MRTSDTGPTRSPGTPPPVQSRPIPIRPTPAAAAPPSPETTVPPAPSAPVDVPPDVQQSGAGDAVVLLAVKQQDDLRAAIVAAAAAIGIPHSVDYGQQNAYSADASARAGAAVEVAAAVVKAFGAEVVPLLAQLASATAAQVKDAVTGGSVVAVTQAFLAVPALKARRKPFYKTWWFWTGVGVVVAGGTGAFLILRRRR